MLYCIHVDSKFFSWEKTNNACLLDRSLDDNHAGVAHDVQAKCSYQENINKFYYEISWESPTEQKKSVSRYRILIMYGLLRMCFQISKLHRKFEFNTTVGFKYGESIRFAVTPEPITRLGKFKSVMKNAITCPVPVILKELPNKCIPFGSNFSFQCKFDEKPVPNAIINWLFTKDHTDCKHGRAIQSSKHIKISKDKQVLEVINANLEHRGCYILTADNGIGVTKEEKGYLDIEMAGKSLLLKKHHQKYRGIGFILVCLIIVVFIICVIFGVVMYICFKRRKKYQIEATTEEAVKNLFISHCTEDEDDKITLLKFASIIKSFNINVIIDTCNEVSINGDGGLSHWIRNNIKTADKIMVILTPSYLVALQAENNNYNENTCKVHLEYNFIDDMLFNNCQKSKDLIIISKDVEPNIFPSIFKNKSFFKFPTKLNVSCDEDMDNNFHGIIGVLLEKEPLQLQLQNQVVGYQRI